MTVLLTVLLTLLKIAGILLLILLALVLVALLLPIGVKVEYKGGWLRLWACAGPLRFKIFAHKMGEPFQKEEPPKPQPAPQQPAAAAPPEKETPLPVFLQKRLDAVLHLAQTDPLALAGRLLDHGGWFTERLLHGLRITELTVFWPITGTDAANTALCYGAAITAANDLLLLLRRHMTIRADELRIVADFTGEQAGQRTVAFALKSRLCILLAVTLRLLHRIWVDPALQPVAQANDK